MPGREHSQASAEARHLRSWTTVAPAKWFCAYSWRVAIRPRTRPFPGTGGAAPFHFVDAPYGHFFADPFVVENNGRIFLFVEDYFYLDRAATLRCAEVDVSGRVIETQTVLRRPYHLSYPQVFGVNGVYYMIPETASAERVELYRAVSFPWKWQLERILLNGVRLYDPTHAIIDGRHWIMAGGCSGGSRSHDELHLFHAPSIHDRFISHPRNPVKTDASSARPGGALIVSGSHLIRPAQNCEGWYGRGLTFMNIDSIDESAYSERPLLTVPGSWAPGNHLGVHTFNASENFEVIDVCDYGLQVPAFAGRVKTVLKRVNRNSAMPRQLPAPDALSGRMTSDRVLITPKH